MTEPHADALLFEVPPQPTPVERLLALADHYTQHNDMLDLLLADSTEPDPATHVAAAQARANATGNRLLGEAFLHRSRVPLDQAPIDHVTAAGWAALQQELGDSAADAQELEDGVIDGCSPWACRGEVEPVQDDFGLAS